MSANAPRQVVAAKVASNANSVHTAVKASSGNSTRTTPNAVSTLENFQDMLTLLGDITDR